MNAPLLQIGGIQNPEGAALLTASLVTLLTSFHELRTSEMIASQALAILGNSQKTTGTTVTNCNFTGEETSIGKSGD